MKGNFRSDKGPVTFAACGKQ